MQLGFSYQDWSQIHLAVPETLWSHALAALLRCWKLSPSCGSKVEGTVAQPCPAQPYCQLSSMQGVAVCSCAGTGKFALAQWGRDGPPLAGLQAVAFGMGGGLLQRVNRDTMSFGEPC